MGEVGAEAMRKLKDEGDLYLSLETGGGSVMDEREEAVAAAVAVVGASARRGVVALCASVAHIIRKNYRLEQQVKELEGRVKALQRLTGIPEDSSAITQCQEYSSANSHSSAASGSVPESPTSQRCGSAPPQFPEGILRPYRTLGAGLRKASDPGSGPTFLRGHTRASTGNLSYGGRTVTSSFVRRKYSSISLRRVRRATLSARQAMTAKLGSQGNKTATLEQQDSNSNNNSSSSSSRSCIVTVAEVYPTPTTTTTTTAAATTTTTAATNNTEGGAVKLLAQKLTTVLLEDSTQQQQQQQQHHQQQQQQQDTDDMVLCGPHPLAGCECLLCLQLLASHPDVLPFEIITDEGSLLPCGSTVLVRGRQVGTVIYFGHCKHQARGTATPQAPLLPPSAPGTCDTPGEGSVRGLVSPLGVMVHLWPPDEGEVFVPLNDVICQLDEEQQQQQQQQENEEGSQGSHDDLIATLTLDEEGSSNCNTSRCVEGSISLEHLENTTLLDRTLTDPQDAQDDLTAKECTVEDTRRVHEKYGVVEERRHLGDRVCSSVAYPSSMYECLGGGQDGGKTRRGRTEETSAIRETTDTSTREHTVFTSSFDAGQKRTRVSGVTTMSQDLEDLEECEKGKLQFGDTWDSGCYGSLGRQSSECSDHFSDLESDTGSSGHRSHPQPWASSLEEALNSVWERHKHQDAFGPYIRRTTTATTTPTPADNFLLLLHTEREVQDYNSHGDKMQEDTVC